MAPMYYQSRCWLSVLTRHLPARPGLHLVSHLSALARSGKSEVVERIDRQATRSRIAADAERRIDAGAVQHAAGVDHHAVEARGNGAEQRETLVRAIEVTLRRATRIDFFVVDVEIVLAVLGRDALQAGRVVTIEARAAVLVVAQVEQRSHVVRRARVEMRRALQRPERLGRRGRQREIAGALVRVERFGDAEVHLDQRIQQIGDVLGVVARRANADARIALLLGRAGIRLEAALRRELDHLLGMFEKVVDDDDQLVADLDGSDVRRHPDRVVLGHGQYASETHASSRGGSDPPMENTPAAGLASNAWGAVRSGRPFAGPFAGALSLQNLALRPTRYVVSPMNDQAG